MNWQPGQRIVVTTTHFNDARSHNLNEVHVVASVRCLEVDDGSGSTTTTTVAEVNTTEPLVHDHYAAAREYQAEVGLLSRNVIFAGGVNDSEPTDNTTVECSDGSFDSYPCENTFLTGYGAHLIVCLLYTSPSPRDRG